MAIIISTPMISMTTISSISVKPDSELCLLRAVICLAYSIVLPILVFCPVEGCAFGFGVDVEDALAAVGVTVRVVLHGAQAPLGFSGHGIDGDLAQKLYFLALHVDAFDEFFEIGRVALTVELGHEGAFVGCILVVVDGVAHLPQLVAKLALFISLDLEACNRDGRGSQNAEDGDGDDQLHQGEAGLRAAPLRGFERSMAALLVELKE